VIEKLKKTLRAEKDEEEKRLKNQTEEGKAIIKKGKETVGIVERKSIVIPTTEDKESMEREKTLFP